MRTLLEDRRPVDLEQRPVDVFVFLVAHLVGTQAGPEARKRKLAAAVCRRSNECVCVWVLS